MAKKGMKEVSGVYTPTTTSPQTNITNDWNKCTKKEICAGFPNSCGTCKLRHGDKKNYYEPEVTYPYYYYPYYYQYPTFTLDGNEPTTVKYG
jgi:hypothetical protein